MVQMKLWGQWESRRESSQEGIRKIHLEANITFYDEHFLEA
jgi:hypothetical protein